MGKIQLNIGVELSDEQLQHLVRIAEVNHMGPVAYLELALVTALQNASAQFRAMSEGKVSPGPRLVRDPKDDSVICKQCGRTFDFLPGTGPKEIVACEDHARLVGADEVESIEEAALRKWAEGRQGDDRPAV